MTDLPKTYTKHVFVANNITKAIKECKSINCNAHTGAVRCTKHRYITIFARDHVIIIDKNDSCIHNNSLFVPLRWGQPPDSPKNTVLNLIVFKYSKGV